MRLDEIDGMSIDLINAAMGQTMAEPGPGVSVTIPAQTVMSSTHHLAAGAMTEIKRRAAEKGWSQHIWCPKETAEPHGWVPLAEIARKQAEVTAAMWATEYEQNEPNAEGRAIDQEAVDRMFDVSLGMYRGADGEEIILERPSKNGRYATGADWARSRDWSVFWTERVDCTPSKLVAFLRLHRRPWPEMIAKFEKRVRDYPGSAAHDATGIGDVIDAHLNVEAIPIVMRGRARDELFAGHITSIEHDERRAPRIDSAYAEHRYASTDDLYGGGHPPDTFVAAALAYRAARPAASTTFQAQSLPAASRWRIV